MINEKYLCVLQTDFSESVSFMIMPVLFCRDLEIPDRPVYNVKAHKEIVNSIDGVGGLGIGEGAPEIVTGSRDGVLSLYT